jgi:hypothetical protein
MAKRASDPWPSRRRNAIQSAEAVVATVARSLPVNLNRIAATRAVQRIEFTPLLTHGGLAVRNDGFIIYVRCDTGQNVDLTARLAEDGTGRSLPAAMARRARFTIAHEIAHTFFYDIQRMPPRPKAQVHDGVLTTKLEVACNQIAGLILMPETIMQRCFANFDFVCPEELRMLTDTAMVSPEAVIRRFKHLGKLSHPEAILASVSRDGADWTISAISQHYSLRNIFMDAKVGASIKMLVDNRDFVLFGGKAREAYAQYIGHGGKRVMRFACEIGFPSRRSRGLFIVGMPVLE